MTEEFNLALPLTLAGLTTAVIVARAVLDLWRHSGARATLRH